MVEDTAIGGGGSRAFPTTRWSLVLAARTGDAARHAALESLILLYWKPLYFYERRKGATVEAAKDLVQGFFAHLLESDFTKRLDPEKGSLRAYLRMSLDHFARNVHEAETAKKRGGGARALPLDVAPVELELAAAAAHDGGDPGKAFDRAWALAVLERALARLESELGQAPRSCTFAQLRPFFQPGAEAPAYADVARDAGLTVAALKSLLHRTRLRFRALVKEEVRETVRDATDEDAEVDRLLEALA